MKQKNTITMLAEKRRCIEVVDRYLARRADAAYRMALEALERLDTIEPHIKRPGRPRILPNPPK